MKINFSDEKHIPDDNSIFLAGPTLRNSLFKNSWRKTACDILEELKFDGTVYVPEYADSEVGVNLDKQVLWERNGLMKAKVIVFYIPRKFPELPGLTTNVEFGTYLAKKPEATILCCPKDSEKNSYLEWLYNYEKPNSIIFTELYDVLNEAVRMTKI